MRYLLIDNKNICQIEDSKKEEFIDKCEKEYKEIFTWDISPFLLSGNILKKLKKGHVWIVTKPVHITLRKMSKMWWSKLDNETKNKILIKFVKVLTNIHWWNETPTKVDNLYLKQHIK